MLPIFIRQEWLEAMIHYHGTTGNRSLSPLDVGHDDASKRQGGPEEDQYEEGQGHVTYSHLRRDVAASEADTSPSTNTKHLPGNAPLVDAVPASPPGADVPLSLVCSAPLHRFADDLPAAPAPPPRAQQDLA